MKTHTIAATGYSFQHNDPAKARVEGSPPAIIFGIALDAVNEAASKRATLMQDSDLSPQGRERRLKPIHETAWATLAAGYIRLAEFDAATDKREAALVSVPTLDPSASAHAALDSEVRIWYRGLSLGDRTKVMNAVQNDPEAGKRYERTVIALLRSPVPLPADHETAFFASLWKQTKRLDNPGEALAIDADRSASEYGWRGLAILQGVLSVVTGWSRAELLNWLVLDASRIGAAKAFGFGVMEATAAKQAQQAAGRIPTTA